MLTDLPFKPTETAAESNIDSSFAFKNKRPLFNITCGLL